MCPGESGLDLHLVVDAAGLGENRFHLLATVPVIQRTDVIAHIILGVDRLRLFNKTYQGTDVSPYPEGWYAHAETSRRSCSRAGEEASGRPRRVRFRRADAPISHEYRLHMCDKGVRCVGKSSQSLEMLIRDTNIGTFRSGPRFESWPK